MATARWFAGARGSRAMRNRAWAQTSAPPSSTGSRSLGGRAATSWMVWSTRHRAVPSVRSASWANRRYATGASSARGSAASAVWPTFPPTSMASSKPEAPSRSARLARSISSSLCIARFHNASFRKASGGGRSTGSSAGATAASASNASPSRESFVHPRHPSDPLQQRRAIAVKIHRRTRRVYHVDRRFASERTVVGMVPVVLGVWTKSRLC